MALKKPHVKRGETQRRNIPSFLN